jgi:hypothetical protein
VNAVVGRLPCPTPQLDGRTASRHGISDALRSDYAHEIIHVWTAAFAIRLLQTVGFACWVMTMNAARAGLSILYFVFRSDFVTAGQAIKHTRLIILA